MNWNITHYSRIKDESVSWGLLIKTTDDISSGSNTLQMFPGSSDEPKSCILIMPNHKQDVCYLPIGLTALASFVKQLLCRNAF